MYATTFVKTQLKIFTIVLHIWIKQLLNLLAVKFHTKSFLFLVRLIMQSAKKVDFPKQGHIWMCIKDPFPKIWLLESCDTIRSYPQNHVILSEYTPESCDPIRTHQSHMIFYRVPTTPDSET